MFRHLLTIAIRNILKYFNYSLLNILGLAIGISSFLFILIYVSDELKYDRFHTNHKQIFRMNRLYDSNDIHEDAATVSFPFGPALAEDYPDMVKSVVRFFDFQISDMLFENLEDSLNVLKFNEEWFYMADSNVFQMFSFPLLEGDPATVLDRPNTIVLSESTARKYFGNKSPIGHTLRMEEQILFEVTGVMEDLPEQSHFKIDLLASLSTFRVMQNGQFPQTWIWNPCWTYVELYDNITQEQLEAQLPDFHLRQYADFKDQKIELYMQALADIHLQSHHDYEMHPNGKLSYIRILATIGVFCPVPRLYKFYESCYGQFIGARKGDRHEESCRCQEAATQTAIPW